MNVALTPKRFVSSIVASVDWYPSLTKLHHLIIYVTGHEKDENLISIFFYTESKPRQRINSIDLPRQYFKYSTVPTDQRASPSSVILTLSTVAAHAKPAMIIKIVQRTNGTYVVDKKVEISDPRKAQVLRGCVVMKDSSIVVALDYILFILNEDLEILKKIYQEEIHPCEPY